MSASFKKNFSTFMLILGVASAAFTAYFAPFFGMVFDSVSSSSFIEQSKYIFVFLVSNHIFLVALSVIGFFVMGFKSKITGTLVFASIPIANLCVIFVLGQLIGGW